MSYESSADSFDFTNYDNYVPKGAGYQESSDLSYESSADSF